MKTSHVGHYRILEDFATCIGSVQWDRKSGSAWAGKVMASPTVNGTILYYGTTNEDSIPIAEEGAEGFAVDSAWERGDFGAHLWRIDPPAVVPVSLAPHPELLALLGN